MRDEEDASADAGGEGEEEEEVDDDPLSEGCEEDVSSASKGSTKSSETAKDMDDGRGVAAALADVELDSQEDTQAPRWRYRSKSTLQSLATTAVLGGSKENLGSPAESYGGALTGGQEEELQKLLQEISLYECGEPKHPDTAHHDALLLMMGSPTRASTVRGPSFETNTTTIKSFYEASIAKRSTDVYVYMSPIADNRNR